MKENTKVILGTIACAIIGGLSVVGANQTIEAIQNDQIKVTLDGVVQSFKDAATGEAQYPITYKDRTYLPLRNVAELSGLMVDYDASTNTAILDSKNSGGRYLGDNAEGKYFWNYNSLNAYKDKLFIVLSGDNDIVKENTHNNMAASVIRRYPDDYSLQVAVANQLEHEGDSAGWYVKESNYNLYDLLKYEKPIEYKVAAVHNYAQFLVSLAKEGKQSNEYKNYEEILEDLDRGYPLSYTKEEIQGYLQKYDDLIVEMANDTELQKILKEAEGKEYSMDLEAYITAKYTEDYQFMPPKTENKLYFVDTITFMNGNNTTIDNYYDNARAKKVKITLNKTEYIINLDDTPEFQNIYLGWETGEYTKPVNVKIEVLEKYDGRVSNDVYFSGISIPVYNNFVSFAI